MEIVEKLRKVDWRALGVRYVVLFGSATRSSAPRDVDLAVLFDGEPDLGRIGEVVGAAAGALGSAEVDVVVLNWDVPCVLVEEIFTKGVPVFAVDHGQYIDDALRRLKLCWDFEESYRKLRLFETALNAIKARWQLGNDQRPNTEIPQKRTATKYLNTIEMP